MYYLYSPPIGSLPTAQLLGRVGKQTSPKAIELLAQGGTENRAELRSSPHGCELVSSGGWLMDDSGTLHFTNVAALVDMKGQVGSTSIGV